MLQHIELCRCSLTREAGLVRSHKGRYRTGMLNQITQLETGCIPVTRSQKQIIIINTTGADNAKL